MWLRHPHGVSPPAMEKTGWKRIIMWTTLTMLCPLCYHGSFEPAHLPVPGEHSLIYIEAKDRAAGWLCTQDAYLWRTLHFVQLDGTWQRAHVSASVAGRFLEILFEPVVAAGLMRRLPTSRWAAGLPTLYSSIKAKCWGDGCRTCERDGHSCVRRISSWIRFPARPLLRRVGRAWRLAILLHGHGRGTASLVTAARDLRDRTAKLEVLPARAPCRCCQGQRRRVCGLVLDASSMYERTPAQAVYRAAQNLVRALRARGFRGVLVRRSRQLRGRLWRHGGAYLADHFFLSFEAMLITLKASLGVRLARLGNWVFEQTAGLPIGGPLSDLGAALLLGQNEAAWRFHETLPRRAPFADLPRGAAADTIVAQTRYVDDLLAVSGSICEACLETYVREEHRGIPFEVEERSSEGPLRWLDLVVHASRVPPHVAMGMTEREYVLHGAAAPGRFRIMPYLGAEHMDKAKLRSYVRGQLSRWQQVRLSYQEVLRSLCYSVLLLARAGYPTQLVLDVWFACAEDHRYGAVVQAFLETLQPRTRRRLGLAPGAPRRS